MTRANRWLFLGLLTAPLACSSEGNVNIGNQVVGGQLSDYAGVWTGYAQATVFSDGSDQVWLTIQADGQGTVRFGTSPAPAAPTDPHVAPPATTPSVAGPQSAAIPGFSYPIHATQVQSDRIQLGIDYNDFYSAWCALQTPEPARNVPGQGDYYCGPALSSDLANWERPSPQASDCILHEDDGTVITANCDWVDLCMLSSVCACTSTSCTAARVPDGTPLTQYPAEIDGAVDTTGSTLTGTLGRAGDPSSSTIVLHRQN